MPRLRTIELTIPKQGRSMKSLNIAVVSDIHLGTIVGKSRLENIVQRINALDPDIVLLPGDVVDEDIGPVIRNNLGETLRKIRSKYGVIAVTGNHEYIGGVEPACRYLVEHNITMLRDSAMKINDSFYIVGREDLSIRGFAGKTRKTLEELMSGVDKSYPIILMDHQPFHLDEAEKNGADLQLSGHTHHGQLWPFNFITKKVYELSWGYKKKGNTHYYVSCGVGTWGPPVRTGNRPEIVNIKLNFA
jgi:predicted MPP superfamily phosphohydrolase